MPQQPLDIVIRLQEENGHYSGSMDIPIQGAMNIPLEDITAEPERVRFSLAGIPGDAAMDLTVKEPDELEGHRPHAGRQGLEKEPRYDPPKP